MERSSGVEQNLDLTLGSSSYAVRPGVFIRNLDMNKPAVGADHQHHQDQEEIKSSGSIVDGGGETDEVAAEDGQRPKKLRLSKEQTSLLEESFRLSHTLNPRRKEELANMLTLRPRQVEVWFQNRRARTKLKQTEIEFGYLKRCYGSLTEENRRLHMEVEALRANAPSSSSRAPAPRALVICPRCELISAAAAAAAGPSNTGGRSNNGSRSFYRQ